MKHKQFVLRWMLALVILLVGVPAAFAAPEGKEKGGDPSASAGEPSQPNSEAFVRSVALTGQNPIGNVAASGSVIGQSVFPGEAQARSLALRSRPNGEAEADVSFSSQAEAIDYYMAKAQREREAAKADVSFSSQAEAIDYYMAKAKAQREREAAEADVSFSSQAEAIDYYMALNECEQEDPASFSSQAEAIDYFMAKANAEREALASGQVACATVVN